MVKTETEKSVFLKCILYAYWYLTWLEIVIMILKLTYKGSQKLDL